MCSFIRADIGSTPPQRLQPPPQSRGEQALQHAPRAALGREVQGELLRGGGTTLALVLARVLSLLSMATPTEEEQSSRRIDLLYGYPPKPLSKRLGELLSAGAGAGAGGSSVLSLSLSRTVSELCLCNETVTVRYV